MSPWRLKKLRYWSQQTYDILLLIEPFMTNCKILTHQAVINLQYLFYNIYLYKEIPQNYFTLSFLFLIILCYLMYESNCFMLCQKINFFRDLLLQNSEFTKNCISKSAVYTFSLKQEVKKLMFHSCLRILINFLFNVGCSQLQDTT